jgi:NADPH:quinone reductase-like Zn-dependent oxidoreductase
MWLEDHFGNGSILQRNERVKLAASFWNNVGAGMVIGGMAVAKEHGCDYPVIYTREDFVARVKEITRDQKLPVAYDSVGKDTSHARKERGCGWA